ncbi:hypothetical protein [Neptunicella marina]|uniref:Uncharacterized protein n=1 Tax=Neptunicella marina TaxID=2125989 RepID=A0A8J6ISA5_9ALTE|nr:hypothetical protein [Neptunicella marina]MBC3764942.1 hypothetical protein [Neptunicella marina]
MPSFVTQLKHFKDRGFDMLNKLFWPVAENTDQDSISFYTFKAKPNYLKSGEDKKWIALQIKTLSPFAQGDHYVYLSKIGVHIWFARSTLNGTPETAAQIKLPDGEHWIKGQKNNYHQIWKNGVMTECTIDMNTTSPSKPIQFPSSSSGWAVQRKLDKAVKKPLFWFLTLCLVLCSAALWAIVGLITATVQAEIVDRENQALSLDLGDKLNIQTQYRTNQQSIKKIQSWQTENGYFPESFAVVARELSKLGSWKLNQITWQNKRLEVEFSTKKMDISSLIEQVEKQALVAQVNIRPHNAQDTWVLEIQIK